MAGSARNQGLDVLRAVAVLSVILSHVPYSMAAQPDWLDVLLLPVQRGGGVGVELFFVISGFLVSGLLFDEHARSGTVSAGHFLLRRGFKIYPAFYFMLGVTLLVYSARGVEVGSERILGEALFLQSYRPRIWGHTWSLAIEEHFYFAIAALFALLARRRGARADAFRSLPWVYAGIATLLLALRIDRASVEPYSHEAFLFPTHLRVDTLFFGVLLRYLHAAHEQALRAFVVRMRFGLVALGVALLSIPFIWARESTPFVYTYGYTLDAWGAGALILVAFQCGVPNGWPSRALAYVGANSYSVYLWHMPAMVWVMPLVLGIVGAAPNFKLAVGAYVASSLVVGIVTARVIEAPALRFRDRWFPSRTRELPAPAAATRAFSR